MSVVCCAAWVRTWHEPEDFGGAAIRSGIGGSTDAHWTSPRGPYVTHSCCRQCAPIATQQFPEALCEII